MKTYGGVDVQINIFLTSALVGAPGTHCIGGWVNPRASLDDWRSENSCSYLDSNYDPSVVQPIASRYTD
jgi:hypothetical protein